MIRNANMPNIPRNRRRVPLNQRKRAPAAYVPLNITEYFITN